MADVRAWLPWENPDDFLGGVPKGYDVDFYAGGEPPASPAEVEFYVPSYMGGGDVLDIVRQMPALKVVQLQTAGVEHVQPRLPPRRRAPVRGRHVVQRPRRPRRVDGRARGRADPGDVPAAAAGRPQPGTRDLA